MFIHSLHQWFETHSYQSYLKQHFPSETSVFPVSSIDDYMDGKWNQYEKLYLQSCKDDLAEEFKELKKKFYEVTFQSIFQFENVKKMYDMSLQFDKAEQFKKLRKIVLPEQRTEQWYAMRKKMITASDIATALGQNPYQTSLELLFKKCGWYQYSIGNDVTQWGVKYEDIAVLLYEKKYQCKVHEFGLIEHHTYPFIGASPDGITDNGVMIEIKCPKSRKITGFPPHYYFTQMQIQLECCDLEKCDFLECNIQECNLEEFKQYDGDKGMIYEIFYVPTTHSIEKLHQLDYLNKLGIKDKTNIQYKIITATEMKDDTHLVRVCIENNMYKVHYPTYWKCLEMSIIPIYRDRVWFQRELPNLIQFWSKVLFYRQEGHHFLLEHDLEWSKKIARFVNTKKFIKMDVCEPILTDLLSLFKKNNENDDRASPTQDIDTFSFIKQLPKKNTVPNLSIPMFVDRKKTIEQESKPLFKFAFM